MLKHLLVLLIVLIVSTNAAMLHASVSWYQTNGPEGGMINALAVAPSNSETIYAASATDVYKTMNGGTFWSPVSNGLPKSPALTLLIDPDNNETIYVGTVDGVFKSTNGGASWLTANVGLSNSLVRTLAFDPNDSTVVYAGTDAGVYKSINGGSSWTAAMPSSDAPLTYVLVAAPADSTIYAGTTKGIYKSANGGATWSPLNTGLPNTSILSLAIDPNNNSIMYAGTASQGIYKTATGGTSWSATNNGVNYAYSGIKAIMIDPTENMVYAAMKYGVVKKSNFDSYWWPVRLCPEEASVNAIVKVNGSISIFYTATSGGVFKTNDNGLSYTAPNTGLKVSTITALVASASDGKTAYTGTARGFLRTTDGGITWRQANNGLSLAAETGIHAMAIGSYTSTVYLGTTGGIYRSTDSGDNWMLLTTTPQYPNVYSLAVDPANRRTLYAGGYNVLLKSTDDGMSWTPLNSGLTNPWIYALAVDPVNNQIVYAGTNLGIIKSSDGGTTWSAPVTGTADKAISSLLIDQKNRQNIYAGTKWQGIIKSINGGSSWETINNGLPDTQISSMVATDDANGTLYAATMNGVTMSTDGGAMWSDASTGLTNQRVTALAVIPGSSLSFYAGTDGSGVFRTGATQFYISGFVTLAGSAPQCAHFPNATCSCSDITGGWGYVCEVPSGWGGTLTPSEYAYRFTPASRTYALVSADVPEQNYSGETSPRYPLTVTKTGTGDGTVRVLSTLASWTSSSYTEYFYEGTVVTVDPLQDVNSTFSGWSGCDSVLGAGCTVTMTSAREVTVNFTDAIKAKVGSARYKTLNDAYNSAMDGATIMLRDDQLDESLTMNTSKNIKISGGYNSDFSAQSGMMTELHGVLTVITGSLEVDALTVQ